MKEKLGLVKLSENALNEVKAGLVAGCVYANAAFAMDAAPGGCKCEGCTSCPREQGPCCVIYNPAVIKEEV